MADQLKNPYDELISPDVLKAALGIAPISKEEEMQKDMQALAEHLRATPSRQAGFGYGGIGTGLDTSTSRISGALMLRSQMNERKRLLDEYMSKLDDLYKSFKKPQTDTPADPSNMAEGTAPF